MSYTVLKPFGKTQLQQAVRKQKFRNHGKHAWSGTPMPLKLLYLWRFGYNHSVWSPGICPSPWQCMHLLAAPSSRLPLCFYCSTEFCLQRQWSSVISDNRTHGRHTCFSDKKKSVYVSSEPTLGRWFPAARRGDFCVLSPVSRLRTSIFPIGSSIILVASLQWAIASN
jgi:hypothetical protein